jgi:hypothetical protein
MAPCRRCSRRRKRTKFARWDSLVIGAGSSSAECWKLSWPITFTFTRANSLERNGRLVPQLWPRGCPVASGTAHCCTWNETNGRWKPAQKRYAHRGLWTQFPQAPQVLFVAGELYQEGIGNFCSPIRLDWKPLGSHLLGGCWGDSKFADRLIVDRPPGRLNVRSGFDPARQWIRHATRGSE